MDGTFVEITPNMTLSSMFEYRLYFMISRVYYYSQANKVKSKLILVMPKFTDEYIQNHFDEMRCHYSMRTVQRYKDIFRPAIQNDLFEIIGILITEDDIRHIEEL